MLVGIMVGAYLPHAAAQAQTQAQSSTLPPIFEEGAQLMGPLGPIEVHEVLGDWVRAKLSAGLAGSSNNEHWIHITTIPGTWSVDTAALKNKKK
jgi:hypothetical protein